MLRVGPWSSRTTVLRTRGGVSRKAHTRRSGHVRTRPCGRCGTPAVCKRREAPRGRTLPAPCPRPSGLQSRGRGCVWVSAARAGCSATAARAERRSCRRALGTSDGAPVRASAGLRAPPAGRPAHSPPLPASSRPRFPRPALPASPPARARGSLASESPQSGRAVLTLPKQVFVEEVTRYTRPEPRPRPGARRA